MIGNFLRAQLDRLNGLLGSPELNAQLVSHGLTVLSARYEQLTADLPELEATYAALVEETGRLAELADERRRQLADLDAAVDAALADVRADELDRALAAVDHPEPEQGSDDEETSDPEEEAAAQARLEGYVTAAIGTDLPEVPKPRRGLGQLLDR